MLRKRKKKPLGQRILIMGGLFLILFLIFYTFSSSTKKNQSDLQLSGSESIVGSGDVLIEPTGTGTALLETGSQPQEISGEATSGDATTLSISSTNRYPVDLCNRIVNLYECIIQHAPIENQPTMKESLNHTTQERNLLAIPQLNSICEAIIQEEIFINVKEHYTQEPINCTF